jgi:hypothetical protein
MRLQNGYELEGTIRHNCVLLGTEWTQILIIETPIDKEQATQLFQSNLLIIEDLENVEVYHYTKGLIKVETENDKSYVWVYFDRSTERVTDSSFKSQLNMILKYLLQ